MISAKTKVCGLIGDPVEHSMSPKMHNAAFEKLNLGYVYVAFHVRAEYLKNAMEGMRAFGIRGLNVTIPHKVAVMKFLDEIDETAKNIGAVNTIVNDGGELKGFNTDGIGALRALMESGVDPNRKNIVMLGAGGAARAISFYIAPLAEKFTIINRTMENALTLADNLTKVIGKKVSGIESTEKNLKQNLKDVDILINATSIGMSPNVNETPLNSNYIHPDMTVFDIVYNPIKTKLLKEAEEAGAKTVAGVGMLVYQGAEAFKIWTGSDAPVDLMKDIVLKELMSK